MKITDEWLDETRAMADPGTDLPHAHEVLPRVLVLCDEVTDLRAQVKMLENDRQELTTEIYKTIDANLALKRRLEDS